MVYFGLTGLYTLSESGAVLFRRVDPMTANAIDAVGSPQAFPRNSASLPTRVVMDS